MEIRKGQDSVKLDETEFKKRMREKFFDPNFNEIESEVAKVIEVAYRNYAAGRKAPVTRKAGPEFKDPTYDMSVEWLATRDKLLAAEKHQKSTGAKSRILIVCASPRNDQTCPGEVSKTWRLAKLAQAEIEARPGFEVEFLDLSRLTAEYGKNIHPCKACVSTAMPLCHWPCSCYPNNSLGQTGDWMADIYEMWVKAHGILMVTPVHWYQVPAPMKLMMDRLVCADGGNADPTTTHGKDAKKAKEIEISGWNFPKHLEGRSFAVVVHGDSAGVDEVRRNLVDWMSDLHLINAGAPSELARYIGYYKPYATSHEDLDKDFDFQKEVKASANVLVDHVALTRAGKLREPRAPADSIRKK